MANRIWMARMSQRYKIHSRTLANYTEWDLITYFERVGTMFRRNNGVTSPAKTHGSWARIWVAVGKWHFWMTADSRFLSSVYALTIQYAFFRDAITATNATRNPAMTTSRVCHKRTTGLQSGQNTCKANTVTNSSRISCFGRVRFGVRNGMSVCNKRWRRSKPTNYIFSWSTYTFDRTSTSYTAITTKILKRILHAEVCFCCFSWCGYTWIGRPLYGVTVTEDSTTRISAICERREASQIGVVCR